MCVVRPHKMKSKNETPNSSCDRDLEAAGNVNSPSPAIAPEELVTGSFCKSEKMMTLSKEALTSHKSLVFENRVHMWIMPLSLSQSNYGGRKKPSSACTIITVQIAHDFLSWKIPVPNPRTLKKQNLPSHILDVLVNAIVDGNETHEKAMIARRRGHCGSLKKKDLEDIEITDEFQSNNSIFCSLLKRRLQRDTFTVPEAIKVHCPEMHEMDFKSYTGHFISNLITAIDMVVLSSLLTYHDRLPLGVLAFERAMCFIFDRPSNTITLLDTHMHFHGKSGSIIASSSYSNLTDFIISVVRCVFPEVFRCSELTGQFEITCLMLSEISNKIYRGQIFLPIVTAPRMTVNAIKAKKTKLIKEKDGNDSGYESDDEN